MELKDLVGEHLIDAVDFSKRKVKTWGHEREDAQAIRFRLDGIVYMAIEDPTDGYRSHMKDLAVSRKEKMRNTFPPVRVIGRYREQGGPDRENEGADILELVDAVTGGIVLEVGTENTEDYYPYFVASFHPEAMSINAMRG